MVVAVLVAQPRATLAMDSNGNRTRRHPGRDDEVWAGSGASVAAGGRAGGRRLLVLGVLATAVRLDAPADPGLVRLGWSAWRADGVVVDVGAARPKDCAPVTSSPPSPVTR